LEFILNFPGIISNPAIMTSIDNKLDKDDLSVVSATVGPIEGAITFELPDRAVEKKLVRKLDMIVLPLLAIIYFTHSLDRANLGNAKTDGFEADIGLKADQYSLILILFYIPYGMLHTRSSEQR
jgi:hypothetical protein